MALLPYRLGHGCVRRRRYVLTGWLVLLVVVVVWAKAANGSTTDALSIPGTESQRAADLLAERFPAQSGATMRIAVEAPAGSKLSDIVSPTQLDADLKQLATLPNVVMPADPPSLVTVSPDGRTPSSRCASTSRRRRGDRTAPDGLLGLRQTVAR